MQPAIILSLMLGSIYGLLFFSVVGGKRYSMWAFWLAGAVGFVAGQLMAGYVAMSSVMLGDVHLVEGSAGSLLAILIVLLSRGSRPRAT